jgi:dTDP-4-dehydrorhamnose 3,5-epimerase
MYLPNKEIIGIEIYKFTTHSDFRGTFSRFPSTILQNISLNTYIATAVNYNSKTLRGLHSQTLEFPEEKYVFCTSGMIFDVVVDLRSGSKTFGDWTSIMLSPTGTSNGIKIPSGCAHGYLTLEPSTSVIYRIDGEYAPSHARNIKWDDPIFKIDWPESPEYVSESDLSINHLRESEVHNWK